MDKTDDLTPEKRIIEGYEVKHAIRLAGGEVVLAENENAKKTYLVCDCSNNNAFGIDEYKNAIVSEDFLEIAKEFAQRLTKRVELIEAERSQCGLPLETLTAADCQPNSMDKNLEGCVVVIKPEKLAPEYRFSFDQIAVCTGGFGARANARGRAVFCTNLYSGESNRWTRQDIAGIIKPERLPDWALSILATEKFAALQKPAEKESVAEKIRQAKQTAEPKKTINRNRDRDGMER